MPCSSHVAAQTTTCTRPAIKHIANHLRKQQYYKQTISTVGSFDLGSVTRASADLRLPTSLPSDSRFRRGQFQVSYSQSTDQDSRPRSLDQLLWEPLWKGIIVAKITILCYFKDNKYRPTRWLKILLAGTVEKAMFAIDVQAGEDDK